MSFILEKGRKAYSGYFYCVVSITTTKALFTLGARVVVPGYRHQMVLCSDTGYPRYQHHLSALYSGTETVPEFSAVGTWKLGHGHGTRILLWALGKMLCSH